jgi:hypothetical protein
VSDRSLLARRGRRLEYFTIGWNSIEGLVSVGAGVAARRVPRARVPCPVCNAGDAPRDPPGFVPFSTPRAAAIHWAEGERRVIEGADS